MWICTNVSPPWLKGRNAGSKLATTLGVLLFVVIFLPYQSVSQLAKGQSRWVGNILAGTMWPDFADYWNQMTPENAGKWGSVEGSQGNYNWTQLDAIYNYAINRGFPFKHHTLVWGAQQPNWISGLDSASQRAAIRRWIDTVAQRYPSVSFVDVVNEPLNAPPDGGSGRANYIRALGGAGATGWDWVVTAFQMARQAFFPTVKLFLNEYNVIHSNTTTTTYLRLIDTLRVRGLIHGIGVQGHGFEFKGTNYTYDINTLKSNLDRLVATGLPVHISEFDLSDANDQNQLQDYKTYFPLFWANPGVKGITLWGYVQGNIWRQDAYLVRANGTERPALQWLRIYVATPAIVSPTGTGVVRNPFLVWRRSTPATSYRVQVAADSVFTSLIVDTGVADTVLQLSPLSSSTKYFWRVSAVNANGESLPSAPATFTTGTLVGTTDDVAQIPDKFRLFQNHPNPFNPSTSIRYELPTASSVRLTVFSLLGGRIRTLVDETQGAGVHSAVWNGTDEGGNAVSSGPYFYRLETGSTILTKKLMLLR